MPIQVHHSRLPFRGPDVQESHKPPVPVFTRLREVFSKIDKQDLGYDDSAVASQTISKWIFPKSNVAGPIASLATTAVVTPIVALSAKAAIEDAHEHFTRTYPAARRAVEEEQAEYHELRFENCVEREGPFSDAAYLSNQRLERLEKERVLARLERDNTVFPAVGMPMLTAGLVTSAAATLTGAIPAAAAAASVLSVAAPGIFIPAQAVLAAGGAHRAYIGVQQARQLKQDGKDLAKLSDRLPPEQMRILQQQNQLERSHNKKSNIVAGAGTATGQVLMATGTGLSMGGITALAGIPILGAGVGISLASAATSARSDSQHDKATGAKQASQDARLEAALSETALKAQVKAGSVDAGIANAASRHATRSEQVAKGKLYSIIAHVIDKEPDTQGGEDRRVTAWARRQAVTQIVETGKKSVFRGTTLLPEDKYRLQQLFDHERFGYAFFTGTKVQVQQRLAQAIEREAAARPLSDMVEFRERVMRKTTERALKDKDNHALKAFIAPREYDGALKKNERVISDQSWVRFRDTNAGLQHAYNATYASVAAQQLKADGKYLRTRYAEHLLDLSRTRHLRDGEHAEYRALRASLTGKPEWSAPPVPEIRIEDVPDEQTTHL